MDPEALRAFARRDWRMVDRLDRAHWAALLHGAARLTADVDVLPRLEAALRLARDV